MKRSTRSTKSPSIMVVEEKRISVGNFSTKFSLPSFVRRVDKLTRDQRAAIQRTGFGNLLNIHNQLLNKNLLVELMDRWDSGKQAFLLPAGEITITSTDVTLILGLRSVGSPVTLDQDELPFSALEEEYGAASWNGKISVSFIEERLESLGELASEDFVRAFLLFTFGTFLFPNTNGKVDTRYLCFLKDLDKVSRFAWGAAVLEDTFSWLSRRRDKHVQYVGGCLILLQVWSYEHIDTLRPNLVERQLKFPRACRWESSRSSNQRQWYAAMFDELGEKQITWRLPVSAVESEMEMVKELLETESACQEVSAVADQNGVGSISERCEISFGVVASESLVSCAESSPASADNCLPVIQEEHAGHPSGSTHCLEGVGRRNLETENMDMRKKVEKLRKENVMLQEENEKLRKEVEGLKREKDCSSLSAGFLVARLEEILQDYAEDSIEDIDNSWS